MKRPSQTRGLASFLLLIGTLLLVAGVGELMEAHGRNTLILLATGFLVLWRTDWSHFADEPNFTGPDPHDHFDARRWDDLPE